GLRVAVTAALLLAGAAGGRGDHPVVVTAAVGRAALRTTLRTARLLPAGVLLRVSGRGRGPGLVALRSTGAAGTAGTARAAGATRAAVPGRAGRDRLGGTVHLRGARTLVVVRVAASVGGGG